MWAGAVKARHRLQVRQLPVVLQHVGHAVLAGVPVLARAHDLHAGAEAPLDLAQHRQPQAERVARLRGPAVEEDPHRPVRACAPQRAGTGHRPPPDDRRPRGRRRRGRRRPARACRRSPGAPGARPARAPRDAPPAGWKTGSKSCTKKKRAGAPVSRQREGAGPGGGDRRVAAASGRRPADGGIGRARGTRRRWCRAPGGWSAVVAVVDLVAALNRARGEVVGKAQHGVDPPP